MTPLVECLPCLEAKEKAGLLGGLGRARIKELRQAAKVQRFGAAANVFTPKSAAAMIDAYKKPDSRWNTTCRCGKPAYEGFNSYECSGGCKR